ncbi:uncharacterized protein LOC105192507 [Harpegnathos saltator]|uniref:Uncharacterized protein n=1 Tax=Harpegnathos saltator TaxID=610380 RepID=E2B2X1_HARSA|nr:uncharacterized protein LOC105192507 [Harpegnathos saltator]EFN89940.1 hypothetical protein EAI_15239 [Harpegnathos saltator]
MLLPYVLLLLPALVAAQTGSQATKTLARRDDTSGGALDLIGESFLDVIDTFLPASKSHTAEEHRRKKFKLNKYVLPLIVGFVLIKSILLPIALKALAVLSGKAVVLSLMSLILAAIVGLKKVVQKESHHDNNKYRRQDIFDFMEEAQELEPYRYYKERRRKK